MSTLGKHHTEETKMKIREARKGQIPWNKGKTGIYSKDILIKMREAHTGEKNHQWKGGQFTSLLGYVHIKMPEHPRANIDGYVQRSHLVAEKKLGRYLFPDEITHHKNGIRDDDRPENIDVMTRGEHTSLHHKQRKIAKSKSI